MQASTAIIIARRSTARSRASVRLVSLIWKRGFIVNRWNIGNGVNPVTKRLTRKVKEILISSCQLRLTTQSYGAQRGRPATKQEVLEVSRPSDREALYHPDGRLAIAISRSPSAMRTSAPDSPERGPATRHVASLVAYNTEKVLDRRPAFCDRIEIAHAGKLCGPSDGDQGMKVNMRGW